MDSFPSVPQVSVVMGVYNAGLGLDATLDSILREQAEVLEVVVVDDGSNDGSEALLDQRASEDARLRVIHRRNGGLTSALIEGCELARGTYIARQDAGDLSLPGRLKAQVAALRNNPRAVLCAVGAVFVDDEGRELYRVAPDSDELARNLRATRAQALRGPAHHGATLFRRDAYIEAGGYRKAFRVAQDLDLWTRMIELGEVLALPQILYKAVWAPGSISHLRRDQQLIATSAIVESRELRRSGVDDSGLLRELEERLNTKRRKIAPGRMELARYHYFLGSLLVNRDREAARRRLLASVREWPFQPKAWWKLVWL